MLVLLNQWQTKLKDEREEGWVYIALRMLNWSQVVSDPADLLP